MENYLAMLNFACAWITLRAEGFFGEALSPAEKSRIDKCIEIISASRLSQQGKKG